MESLALPLVASSGTTKLANLMRKKLAQPTQLNRNRSRCRPRFDERDLIGAGTEDEAALVFSS
jgi:hypothetical protein